MSGRLLAINPVDHPGGAEVTLIRLLDGLRDRGWTVTLTTPNAGPLSNWASRAGARHVALPVGGLGRGQGARALASYPAARRLAAASDVVYLNGTVTGRLLPAVCARTAGTGARTVLHVHDMVQRVPALWRLADTVLADSRAVAVPLAGLDPVVVHLPVDLDPPVATAPWPAGPGPVIGFVGRLEPRKGVLDLLAAVPAIRAGSPQARVVLIGDDPYGAAPDYTAEVLSRARAEQVTHIPWSDNAPGLMRHLDVLVLPSHQEPFGTVLAEAMAVGTPVVATAVDGLPEVVADGVTGRLVAPRDPVALAAAVLEVLAQRDQMGAAAREHARQFATPGYVERVERLLQA
jgi:glycosyltransferase involved in cell wall biosynthesis